MLVAIFQTSALRTLARLGWIRVLHGASQADTAGQATSQDLFEGYWWHTADAVPFVKIPTSWTWENPIRIVGDGAWLGGVSFMLARALIALGIVGLIIEGWRFLRPDDQVDNVITCRC